MDVELTRRVFREIARETIAKVVREAAEADALRDAATGLVLEVEDAAAEDLDARAGETEEAAAIKLRAVARYARHLDDDIARLLVDADGATIATAERLIDVDVDEADLAEADAALERAVLDICAVAAEHSLTPQPPVFNPI